MKDNRITVICDEAKHHPRLVPVTSFRPITDGQWHEIPSSRAGKTAGTGYTLHGSAVDQPGWALDASTPSTHRVNFDLVCRKCHKPWTLGEAKLFAALESLARIGESQVSLVALAAIVKRQAEG